jgi:hypothetical protein
VQIKAADSRQPEILALERLLDRPAIPTATRNRIDAEIRQIQAGERGERDATYHIELYFGRSQNWASIHDLRIEVDGLTAQIDHLLINRLAEVWVCESKSFAEGVTINEHGEWLRWWNGKPEGIPSPIEQNHRHIHLLKRVVDDGLVQRPRRLGLVPMNPDFRSLVLVSNNARIGRPKGKIDGVDEVIKAEQLKTRLFDEFDKAREWRLARVIGKEGLEAFARDLAALHRPTTFDWPTRFGLDGSLARQPASAQSDGGLSIAAIAPVRAPQPWTVKYDGPCSQCGKLLPKGVPAVWRQRERRMLCLECGSEA